jgi:hypothetical protein
LTTLTLANSQVLVTAGNSVAPISVAGIYSIINTVYDKSGSTFTGTSTNSISYFQYINADGFTQEGANSFILQQGASSYIEQTGASPYIKQAGTTGYVQPAQIKDSAGLFGSAGEVLVSLGTNLGVEWQDKNQIGSFFDVTSQTSPTAGTARPMIFGSDAIVGFGVSVTNDTAVQKTQIVVTERGYYNVQFAAQVRNSTTDTTIDVWFRRNGTDIANSNKAVTIPNNHFDIISWNYFVLLDTTDVLQIMWAHDNGAHPPQLSYQAATAPHPATPSTILTVNRVR